MAFEGEILEIFSWLPASSILKFTSVCKELNEFASDPFFVKKQHRNMLLSDESGFFIQPNSCQRYSDKLEFYALSGPSPGLPREFVEFLKNTVRCMASSNGLVCYRNTSNIGIDGNYFFISNPATQSVQPIPAPTSLKEASKNFQILFECNFGSLDETPYDYLLMVIEGTEHWSSELLCKIYSPREGVWEDRGRIEIGARNILYDQFPVYHNGCAYFLSDWYNYITKGSIFYRPYVVEYNLKNGTSRFLKLPKNIGRRNLLHQSCKFAIFEMGRGLGKSVCLIMLVKGVFVVWALADHSSGSWTQIFKMRAQAMGIIEADAKIAGFTLIKGDYLLVATENRVYQYCLAGDQRNNIRAEELCRHGCGDNVLIQSYSSTLRPCGDNAMRLSK